MPQLDKFTYFTQFFWSCLLLFTFYIPICNDGDGVLGISRILKLRNQLVSHRGNNIRSNDPNSLEDISRKGFSTGVSYMYSSLFEVSQWCNAVDLLGKGRKITLISCFGEISGSRGMERNIFYLISKSSYSTSSNPGWGITCRNDIMLIHVPHGQGSINSGMEGTTRKIYSFSNSPAKMDVQKGSRDYQSSRRAGRERDKAEPLGEPPAAQNELIRDRQVFRNRTEWNCYFPKMLAENPRKKIGGIWPPKGIWVLDPREIPFLNTPIPPSSGAAVTWAHHAILAGKEKRAVYALVATVSLALVSTGFQGMEYYQAPSTISDSIYGSTFSLATGFHGFHVIIGTLFSIICGIRQYLGHLTKEHHVGFEAAAWDRRDYGRSCSPRNDPKLDLGLFEIVPFNRNQRCFLVSRFFSEQIEEPNGSNSSLAATKHIGLALRKERSVLIRRRRLRASNLVLPFPSRHGPARQEESLIHGRRSRHRSVRSEQQAANKELLSAAHYEGNKQRLSRART
ncbi:Cytochrome c oxidase [Macleaya cordata]|uniref:Cytochrome c oxidase subunit 3 n=2 Tax=Papaveroideae TaxID=1462614 RepID=A0A200PSQ2_MACCD|nr:Cytochrome c oxidase [Macleaya cordata]